jgi:hypothetical protein
MVDHEFAATGLGFGVSVTGGFLALAFVNCTKSPKQNSHLFSFTKKHLVH